MIIAHAVAASGNWKVKPYSRRAASTAIGESIEVIGARKLFAAEGKEIAKLLAPAFKGDDAEGGEEDGAVTGRGYQDDELTARVFARLLKMKDVDVARIGAFVMAETLASGFAVTDAFGIHAKVKAF